jgi:hypothetical protein
MAKLTIFRGLPGSGKSTRARALAAQTGAILIEPDALLMVDGKYLYTPARYKQACNNARICLTALTGYDGGDDCDVVLPDIIYADVLPTRQDVQHIIDAMDIPLQNIEVIDCKITPAQSKQRNVHHVRTEDIMRMAKTWEDWIDV